MCECIFSYFLKGFIHIFFKGLYHLYKIGFKILFLCFSFMRISRVYCGKIAGLWWCHIAMDLDHCVLYCPLFSGIGHVKILCHCLPVHLNGQVHHIHILDKCVGYRLEELFIFVIREFTEI